jgi:hypothetical protein
VYETVQSTAWNECTQAHHRDIGKDLHSLYLSSNVSEFLYADEAFYANKGANGKLLEIRSSILQNMRTVCKFDIIDVRGDGIVLNQH